MELTVSLDSANNVVVVKGKLNVATAPELQKAIEQILDAGAASVTLDFSGLDYMASAGLRLLVATQKQLSKRDGVLTIKSPTEVVMDVIYLTGLSAAFNIEQ